MENVDGVLEVPVLVIGAGPAGLTATLLLHQYGIETLTLNRYPWTAHTPRAHHQNQRSLEILRELGLEEEVAAAGMDSAFAQAFVWVETMAGTEFGRLPTHMVSRADEYRRASPCQNSNIPQHLLEPILAKAAMSRGAAFRWGHELLDITQDAESVTATVRDRSDARIYKVRAQFVVAADGARSRAAEALSVRYQGKAGWASAVNVWIKADLARYCEHRPALIYFTNRPGIDFWVGSGAFISVRQWDEWVMSFMYDPEHGEPDLSSGAMVERVRWLVGDATLEVQVKSINSWQMHALVAEQMRVGRVFLAGDAVHRHPPTGGLGSNTSIQDSYNLAWKLAAVLRKEAGVELLGTYQSERLPVAQHVVRRSMENIEIFTEVAAVLGFAEGQDEAAGWAAFAELSAPTAKGTERRRAFRAAMVRQEYQFCAHGTELNVRYPEGALISEPASKPSSVDEELQYVPITSAGSHLPHVWLERNRQRRSTLDVCAPGRFTLIVGHAGQVWREVAISVAARTLVPIDVVAIGLGLDWRDVNEDWTELRGFDDDGCLLVRPDKYIAWRSVNGGADAKRRLIAVMDTILARDQ